MHPAGLFFWYSLVLCTSPLPLSLSRTRNPSKRSTADLRLRLLGHWERPNSIWKKEIISKERIIAENILQFINEMCLVIKQCLLVNIETYIVVTGLRFIWWLQVTFERPLSLTATVSFYILIFNRYKQVSLCTHQ